MGTRNCGEITNMTSAKYWRSSKLKKKACKYFGKSGKHEKRV